MRVGGVDTAYAARAFLITLGCSDPEPIRFREAFPNGVLSAVASGIDRGQVELYPLHS